jgi:hypothetical protein
MKGWYKTSYGAKYEFYPTDYINLSNHDITELVINDGAIVIHCRDNNLTKLDLPDSVKYIDCRNNNLTELIVPDDCKVSCDESVNIITRTELRSKRIKAILK